MSTLEYELGKHPGPPDLQRVEIDPITMRVLGGAFHAIAKEMSGVLFRMSYSSIIRESEDLGAGIFDAKGRELCESDSTPMHIGSLPWYIRGFMRHLEGKIVEGDVIIHNHPYYGASHSPDIAVAVPIFWEGALQGFAAVTAHVLDVGGSFPGINADAFDVYAEAKLYDGLRWYRAGELNEDLDRMIFDNVRTVSMNRGDMNAMMAACLLLLGRDRMLRLYAECTSARSGSSSRARATARWRRPGRRRVASCPTGPRRCSRRRCRRERARIRRRARPLPCSGRSPCANRAPTPCRTRSARQVGVIGPGIGRRRASRGRRTAPLPDERSGDTPGHVALEGEDVLQAPVEAVRPELGLVRHLHQLHGDPDPVALAADAAFDECSTPSRRPMASTVAAAP